MRLGGAAIIGAAALLATGLGAVRPTWRWPALPAGVAAPSIPADNGMSAAKVALGRRLFYDRALSADGSMACADCHQQEKGFADGLSTHRGVMGDMGVRNVPGLANVAWRSGLTWTEAGLSTLEQQAMVPMTGTKPVEMGLAQDDAGLARRIGADPCYRRMFAAAFPGAQGGVGFAEVTAALAVFQRTMISFGSAHDRGALSPLAARGAAQFKAAGCADCHSGTDLTDSKTHYVGTSAPREADSAAYGGKPLPPGVEPPPEQFRTPSLRNVAVTGPWLHDGQSPTIESAIRRHAAPMLADVDMPALLAFLDALTDHDFLNNAALARPPATCPIPT
ncbi:cytochrome-c peroxidase [Sphingobium sp. AP49]|uniref:cytochrome-c peroxidase n=1 Tax=Sphingobium sp. AP49 TaxID=1144307 RepID=UPI00026ED6ED|nr:cytochrome-c peroxidase [Sphingobium sp. AP49]WHO37261.1 cytochrome-c peroxidase [Sphingobium sp. AP49]